MTDPEEAKPALSGMHCPLCGCAQIQSEVDKLTYVGGISGMDCTTCGNVFTVGETVTINFGGHGEEAK